MGCETIEPIMEDAVLALVTRALQEDIPLDQVTWAVEKAILASAVRRHSCQKAAYEALRVPRATYFLKKKRYDLSELLGDTNPYPRTDGSRT